ncbi:AMP-binding protein [Trueperella pyogenes]|uniref:AMP-binding protein n=1 Tax=Trueperella pyogenes TaxID=1661 RepID=UPI00324EB2E3
MIEVIEGGRGLAALNRVHDAVMGALCTWRSGGTPVPLFVVRPGTDRRETVAEVTGYGVPGGTALLMRTSGSTTGTGKIVAISWESLTASAQATHQALAGPGRWAADLPFEHIAGFQTVVRSALAEIEALAAGAEPERAATFRPLCLPLHDAAATADALAAGPLTYVSVVPTQLGRILADPALTNAFRDAVLLVGGAGTPASLLERARAAGLVIHTSYGMTETCGGCVYDGRPIGDTEIFLDGGRICLRGRVVATGYLGADTGFDPPASTRLPGTPATHRTRDAGRITDSSLEVLGRLDDAITTGGLTVMPGLIEDSLARAGYTAVVVGVAHLEWGEAVVAVVDDAGGATQSCDITIMRSWVKLDLGAGWAPSYIVNSNEIGGIPLTPSGKVNRRELAETVSTYLGL